LQQITRESGLAAPQVTAQTQHGTGEFGLVRKLLGKRLTGLFIWPVQAFYNRCLVQRNDVSVQQQGLPAQLQLWGRQLGFSQIGVAPVDLSHAEPGLLAWLAAGHHGSMDYMQRHGLVRARPTELVPGSLSIITARMDYLPRRSSGDAPMPTDNGVAVESASLTNDMPAWLAHESQRLHQPAEAVVSVYARGRDYHKVMRQRLQQLAHQLQTEVGPMGHRVFTDSAPVLEAELAVQSGLGWRGKHTLVLQRDAGSFFFLGEIFVDMALPLSEPVSDHCGSCHACISACPTQAILAPYQLDARRCISYLTIEHDGPIPLPLRPLMGNRIYGCDDCQLVCPWNKFAVRSSLPDFDERHGLGSAKLVQLMQWDEAMFLRMTEGSAIRRIGHVRWLRNLAVAVGNALRAEPALSVDESNALRQAASRWQAHDSEVVRESVAWALEGASMH
jgi:epoxyqueuosine reductase